ncbi:MoaD/ThiS family protein [Tumidithrix helvetica PCC 7403]|uniref:MoaD/ThiS family protein n=1 Tax=Tumidithrix helvetica TaxID=3457545 RepID=UPI003C87D1E9
MSETITVRVKLFAAFQEAIAESEIELTLPPNTAVAKIYDRLLSQYPDLSTQLEPWRSLTRYAVNLEFAEPETLLQNGDEVALIPPVSGG